jgi:glycosyltransferase involved in cell wall biosynthesis
MDAARQAGRPLAVTFHGFDVTTHPEFRRDWEMTKRWRELVSNGHRLLAVSEFIGEQLEGLGAPKDNVERHYIGIPIPPDRGQLQRSGAILFVGRLVEKKGCDLLLQAVAQLPHELRRAPVRIVGDGPERSRLERMADRLGVDAVFLGTQPPDVVDEEMWSASVFVGPSRVASTGDTEGLGMVLLEAAARRLPVITARVGGTPEAVADGATGYVVDPDDPEAIAVRLRQIFGHSQFATQLGAAGRKRVVAHFDVSKQTPLLEDYYDRWLVT